MVTTSPGGSEAQNWRSLKSLARLLLKPNAAAAFSTPGATTGVIFPVGSRTYASSCARCSPVRLAQPNFPAEFCVQLSREVAGVFQAPAYALGFFGACCNWFLGCSAVYDALKTGPEVISLPMTCVMLCYSSLFAVWAGWAVEPRNYILCASHIFNVLCQSNQLRRALAYQFETDPTAKERYLDLGGWVAALSAAIWMLPLKRVLPGLLTSVGGLLTIHSAPPLTKLGISLTSLLEFDRPTDKISIAQYSALTVTAAIFSVYGLLVIPINYFLSGVNLLLFLSSAYHLGRKIKADFIRA